MSSILILTVVFVVLPRPPPCHYTARPLSVFLCVSIHRGVPAAPTAVPTARAVEDENLATQEVDQTQRQDLRNLAIVAHVGELGYQVEVCMIISYFGYVIKRGCAVSCTDQLHNSVICLWSRAT